MKRLIKIASLLSLSLLVLPTYAQNVNAPANVDISPAERTKIEEVVHQYLLRKPEVVVEALQAMQRKQYDEAQQTMQQTQKDATRFANALFHHASDPIGGNPNGKVAVVEFFDYQCPHCVAMVPTIKNIISANPDVKVIYKELPLLGPMSETASRAALAAHKQGKYAALSQAMLNTKQPLTQEYIIQLAGQNGIDVEKLKTDMNSAAVDAELKANTKLAQDLKLFGTPAFFIAKADVSDNKGTIIYAPGRIPEKQLQAEIDKVK